MAKIGVAVVGYGGMGVHHCNQMMRVEGLHLCAVCDSNPTCREQAKEKLNVKVYASMDELLKDSTVEVVVLVTPHNTHAPLTVQALSAGRHVVVEKAMCLTVKEADRMIEASEKAGKTLTVFQNRRNDSDFQTAMKVLQSGVLGEVYRIEAAINYYGPQDGWRAKKEFSGGYIYDGGGHMADQLVLLAGSAPKTVFADLQKRIWTDVMDSETYANIVVRFENGITTELDMSSIMWYRKPRFVIMGEKGTFVALAHENFGQADCFVYTETAGLRSRNEIQSVPGNPGLDGMLKYYQQLADHFIRGVAVPVDPNQVRESIGIIEAAFRSAQTGVAIDVASL